MELADEQRYKGLKGLYADSMGVRPHVITQARLKELFGEHASSKERTDIHLTDTSVLNSGSIPVYISLQVNNLFQVRMDFPVFIEGDVEKFDGHEMNLIFRDEGKSPRITFSDEIFNNRYGGVLRSVAVESSNTYFETSNGCLQLPYQKSTKAEFDLRTARVSKDVLGIDVNKLLDLRATSVSCSVGTGGLQMELVPVSRVPVYFAVVILMAIPTPQEFVAR